MTLVLRRPRRGSRRREELLPFLLLIPAAIVVLALTAWPLIQLLVMSMQEFGRAQIFGAAPDWIWFENYAEVLGDKTFWVVLGRSILFALVNVVTTMLIGILIALLMTRLGRAFKLLVSVGLLLAWAMPPITATVVWGWLFDTDSGVVNYVLTTFLGLDFAGHSWLIQPLSFFFVATVIITWQSVPFVAFTVYAGLTQVPTEVLEAAQLDGSTGFQRFRFVTFPFIRPVLLVLLLLQIIWDMRVFPQIKALQTIGGIAADTNTIGPYIYSVSIAGGNLGVGGAIAVILVVVMMILSAYYIRSTIRQDEA
ncbi:MAG TPA: sugar ABC transporter permease [Pseudolysinimonas sp.]|nr:sugar ABC transporter permease [Pseudolysinimonas sp.]